MTEQKTTKKPAAKKATNKKCVALRNICTEKDGNVKAGSDCTCTPKEYETFKKVGAV